MIGISHTNRPKQSKSQTPTRIALSRQGVGLGLAKKSDPFMREPFKQIQKAKDGNKQNCHPNLKENRVKSQASKQSPAKKVLFVRNLNRTANAGLHSGGKTGQVNGYKQANSAQLQRLSTNLKSSHKKYYESSDGVFNGGMQNFIDEYYTGNDQKIKREEKVKVTLKDIKKTRKSIMEGDKDYGRQHFNLEKSIQKSQNYDDLTLALDGKSPSKGKNYISKQKSFTEESQVNSSENVRPKCYNHQQKQARYRLFREFNQDQPYYCSKCAVTLVTQGYKVTELQLSYMENIVEPSQQESGIKENRIERLKDFLFQVDKLDPVFRRTRNDLENLRKQITLRYEEQQHLVVNYYRQIFQKLSTLQRQSLTALRIFSENSFQELQRCACDLARSQQQVNFMKEDILPNIDSIVNCKSLSEESFDTIIDDHQCKLKAIDSLLTQLIDSKFLCATFNEEMMTKISKQGNFFKPQLCEKLVCLQRIGSNHKPRNEEESQFRADSFRMSFGKQAQSPSFCKPF